MLWDSKIRLGEDFFNEIISHPVPLNMNTLTALKRSPLGLDLYLWLTYRTFTLRASQRLSWANLYRQFGMTPDKASDRVTIRNFQRKVLRELEKIKLAWPELRDGSGGLDPLVLDTGYRPSQSRPARKLISPFPASQRPVSDLNVQFLTNGEVAPDSEALQTARS